MNKNNSVGFVVALAMWAAIAVPGRSQASPVEIPILTQYVGYSDIFFARSDDPGILTCASDPNNGNSEGEWSNVLVAVTGGRGQRTFKSLTEFWTDTAGRPHSLSVLKIQIEYNDALIAKNYYIGRPGGKIDGLVPESGVLDGQTLAISYTKLSIRAKSISQKLDYERSVASAQSAIDSGVAGEKEQLVSFVAEKLSDAWSKLASLRAAVEGVPLKQTSYIPAPLTHVDARDGLRWLKFAWAGLSSSGRDKSGNLLYQSGDYDVPELSIKDFVDPAGMTPAVVADILEKEAAAAKAVGIAESLFKDLFTPP